MHPYPAVLLSLAFTVHVAGQSGYWAELTLPTSPSGRYGASMVYDGARDRLVLVGGTTNGGSSAFTETWEHDGSQWTLEASNGPGGSAVWYPQPFLAATYDSVRRRTVVVESNPSNGNFQTWEWDGNTWQMLTNGSVPPGRTGLALAFDSARGVTVMFGGKSNYTGHLADTWEWDGAAWTQRSSGGPAPRQGHAMAYDSTRGTVVLFGGRLDVSPNTSFAETWEWNGLYWQQYFGISEPAPRFAHSMAFDAARGVTVLHGGKTQQGNHYTDTWEWDGGQWVNRAAPTTAGNWTTMCYDSQRQRTVMFGGQDQYGNIFDKTVAYTVTSHAASLTQYGSGCAGPNGVPSLGAVAGDVPRLGTTLQLRMASLPTGLLNVPVGWLGFSDTQWAGIPLPLALDPFGFLGCTALLAPEAFYVLNNAGGHADWDLDIPFLPAFAGLQFYVQGGVMVLGHNPGGLVFSQGLAGIVGS